MIISERKNYIDNIRFVSILLLVPFHALQLYCTGPHGGYYVSVEENVLLHSISDFIFPSYMSMLFLLAGVSASYALSRRTTGEFIKERISKLLIPLIAGIILYIPVMSFIADRYFNGYTGSYFEHYGVFFTRFTDLSGYDGGFTPGHLWFLLFLFVIVVITLPLMKLIDFAVRKRKKSFTVGYPFLLLIGILLWPTYDILNFGGKSLLQYLMLYLLGFYLFRKDSVMEVVEKHRYISLALWIVTDLLYVFTFEVYQLDGFYITLLYILAGWFGILAVLGVAKHSFSGANRVTRYLTGISFLFYELHMVVLVVIAYFVVQHTANTALVITSVTVLSYAATFALCGIIRRIPVVRKLFGLR